jgi:hypothetical protein
VLIMTGGPGVGNTTIVKAILRILAAKERSTAACERPFIDCWKLTLGPAASAVEKTNRSIATCL